MAKKDPTKKRIVLLDTHAIIHRAYHALPEFTGPTGAPTGALYGLVAMLLKIIADLKPDYIAACYDLPGPTIRHEAYEAYKGTRTKIEDALTLQLSESRKVFEAFSIPLYEREGFEADDLLGTIAHEMRGEKKVDVIIASGDMDTLQLVDDERVRVYTLRKGITDTVLYDEKAVVARFGFPPELIPDWKGLRGDPSDNIKGVPGIGEKTATELIISFGSMEKIYAALKKGDAAFLKKGIKPRIISLLREHEEDARFSKSIATIRLDAPIAFTLPEKPWRENINTQKMFAMCEEFGFRTLKARIKTMFSSSSEDMDAPAMSESAPESVDAERLNEAQVMLWLISSDFTNPSVDDILAFAKERTFGAAYDVLQKKLAASGRVKEVYEKIEKPLIPVVGRMGERGVLMDPDVLSKLKTAYRADLEKIEKRIYTAAGREFNVSSPKQLGEVLFDELKIVPERQKKTAGGQRSTRESELEKIRDAHPVVADILEYRELKKLLSTYVENLPPLLDAEHRLHAEFLQTGTTTGRMASQNPNLQNIPLHSERGRAIRHAFVASRGFALVALDYSQIELRLAAILSGDEKLCAIFKSGRDVHQEVASRVFHVEADKVDPEMRRRAKVINFGILYGMGVNALRSQLGSTTAEAHRYLEDYFSTFKTLSDYLEKTKGFARKHGYTETLFGRRRQFPEMKSSLPYVRAQAERMAINAPLQGTQADIIKLAMVRADDMLAKENAREDAYLLLQVHDELVYEIRTERAGTLGSKIKKIMEAVLAGKETHGVPVIAMMKQGLDWGTMKPL
ncbi:MAG: polymerase protein [Parcubacteria group bacterium GW2011_GWB1_57_6]|nr:MAG: polymerase protein [Parcubacteria group bacterium GW2011_GWA1_56_13]KKW47007.1 MAG: polymerase protein [Parcubacteria group bacterium GW2011_GWB1_57_6]